MSDRRHGRRGARPVEAGKVDFEPSPESVLDVGGLGIGLFVFGLALIAMALVGSSLRRRKRRVLSLWKLIDRHVELSAVDLLRDSDWTPTLWYCLRHRTHLAGLIR